jgi:molecular chaperone DnaK
VDYFGIDFGTTNTAVYRISKSTDGAKIESPLGENGQYPFASVVAIPREGGSWKAGRKIKEKTPDYEKDFYVLSSIKSLLGKGQIELEGKPYKPVNIVCAFLRYVRGTILHKYLGIDIKNLDEKTIKVEAAFSFPVDFSREARGDLKKAAEKAGFTVKAFINEATSAYIANRDLLKSASTIMVIDWGGGTLDVNIIEKKNGEIHEIAVGSKVIGGDDIDQEFAYRVHSLLADKYHTEKSFDKMSAAYQHRLLSACEETKIEFSRPETRDFDIILYNVPDDATQIANKIINIKYDFFEPLVTEIIKDKVVPFIVDIIKTANMTKEGLDKVLIVGGSSNLRPFLNIMINNFGEDKVVSSKEPDFSVAKGAAMFGLSGGQYRLSDDVGILLSDNSFYPLFKKEIHGVGDTIGPVSFSITEDSQSANFIITDSNKKVYERIPVSTKGFLEENINLCASIDEDQITSVKIISASMANQPNNIAHCDIKNLKYFYKLSE